MTSPLLDANSKHTISASTLPSLKGRAGSISPFHSRSVSLARNKIQLANPTQNLTVEYVDELKTENATLRMKLHEIQSQQLENGVKPKSTESSSPNAKLLGNTLAKANTQLFKLETQIKQKDEKILQLGFEKKFIDNLRKEQTKTIETLMQDKNFLLKTAQDLKSELDTLKKTTLNAIMTENRNLKDALFQCDKQSKYDRELIYRQVQAIKILDEKNIEMARNKNLTLNPLYDPLKRSDLYGQAMNTEDGPTHEIDIIKTLNLAFSTDKVLEILLNEKNQELDTGRKSETLSKEDNSLNKKYRDLRDAFIRTRFEFERVDGKLKDEINYLTQTLNDLEEKYHDKCRELEMLSNVLQKGLHLTHSDKKFNEETFNKSLSFHEDVKEILQIASLPKKQEPVQEPVFVQVVSEKKQDKVIRIGQFNSENIFDDTEELKKINVKRVRSIEVWADKKAIIGIEVRYDTLNGTIFKGPRHLSQVSKEKYAQEPWKLDANDSLSRIRGSIAESFGILWIEFITRNGVTKQFGNPEIGTVSFDHQFEHDETPIIVTGSFSIRQRGDKPAKQNISGLGFLALKHDQSLTSFIKENIEEQTLKSSASENAADQDEVNKSHVTSQKVKLKRAASKEKIDVSPVDSSRMNKRASLSNNKSVSDLNKPSKSNITGPDQSKQGRSSVPKFETSKRK